MSPRENFAQAITELRKASGLTQKEVADKMGYHAQFVSNFERAISYPPREKLRAYADALGIKFERLKALYVESRAQEIV